MVLDSAEEVDDFLNALVSRVCLNSSRMVYLGVANVVAAISWLPA